MEKFEELVALLEQTRADADKFFDKGNAAAGTRVRVAMQKVKQLAQDLRVDKNEVKFVNQIVDKYKLKMRFSKKKYFELYK
jgi:hypothetical protein